MISTRLGPICAMQSTVSPNSKGERLPKVSLASFPFVPSLAAVAGRAPLAKCRHGLPRPSHPSSASLLLEG
eukprot:8318487-Pyramimonas_sp.AAC.1